MDRGYVINLDEYADVGTQWIALYVKNIEIIYFGSFGAGYVPKEIEKFIGYKNIKTNICRIQANNLVMCGYFCIGFINFMFAGKTLIDNTSLFLPYDFWGKQWYNCWLFEEWMKLIPLKHLINA